MKREEFVFRILIALLCGIEGSRNVRVEGATNSSFTIKQGDFLCGRNLLCSYNATTNELKLTPDPVPRTENYTYFKETVGVALYNESVQLLDRTTDQVASFNIGFSLRIESGPDRPGDGMAFVMFGNKTRAGYPGGAGGALGAYGSTGVYGVDTLVVEFDTYMSDVLDHDSNHVGIHTIGTTSVVAKEVPFSLHLDRVYAWVDYNSLTATLAVYVDNTTKKPEEPFINCSMDLRDVFDVENVWVGFSASNGVCPCFSTI